MARPKKEIEVPVVTREQIAEWEDSTGTKVSVSNVYPVDSEATKLKRKEIFSRYLDIKKATSIGNIHGVTVVVYDLLNVYSGNDYLFDGEDIKVVLDHFGFKADYIVEAGLEARRDVGALKI